MNTSMALTLDAPIKVTQPGKPDSGFDVDVDHTTDEWLGLDKPWNVILWNDPVTPIDVVVFALIEVVGLEKEQAAKAAIFIHNQGKAIVYTDDEQKAKAVKHKLSEVMGYKLTVSLEQAK